MKRLIQFPPVLFSFVLCLFLLGGGSALAKGQGLNTDRPIEPRGDEAPLVQVALLLDTSGSMEGLINQARGQLWEIVNELSTFRQNGQRPVLEVGLYEYGNDRVSKWSGHVRQISGFTRDLDLISEALFSLSTYGGNEFCGVAIETAIKDLRWTTRKGALKLLYIAGNEPFTQGPVPYVKAINMARKAGVIVNTVYCGDPDGREVVEWKNGAMLAEGSYTAIDHNHQMVDRATPHDARLQELGSKLNRTYVAYGANGKAKKARQFSLDGRVGGLGTKSMAARTKAKSSTLYKNVEWDMVDAMEDNEASIEALAPASLPPQMQGMTIGEVKEAVKKQASARVKIQAEIKAVSEKRDAFLAEKRPKNGPDTLEEGLLAPLRNAAKAQGFTTK